MSLLARLVVLSLLGGFMPAPAAEAPLPPPARVVDILEALRAGGANVLFSSELVPPDLESTSRLPDTDPKTRAIEALAQHQLALVETGPGRYVVTRLPKAAPVAIVKAKPDAEAPQGDIQAVSVYASRYTLPLDRLQAPIDLSGDVIARIPGSQNDALRATRSLPGLASNTSSRPYIRGSKPDDILMQFDGVPLIDPFHFKDFQSLVSVFDSSAVDRVEVYSGGFPVQYGSRSGGIIDITPRTVPAGYEVSIGASLLVTSASSVGHSDDAALDWLATVRNSTRDLTLKPVNASVGEPQFTDSLGRVRWQASADTALIAGWLLLDDRIQLGTDPVQESVTARYRDEYGWLGLEQTVGGRWRGRTIVSAAHGERSRNGAFASPSIASGQVSEIRDFSSAELHSSWTYQESPSESWLLGVEAGYERADLHYSRTLTLLPDIASGFSMPVRDDLIAATEPTARTVGLFGSVRRHWRALEAELGFRFDEQHHVAAASSSQWSPRLNLRYDFSGRWKAYGSWGRFTQAQRPNEWRIEQGQAAADPAALAVHAIVGLSFRQSDATTWRAEGYRKRWTTVPPYFDNSLNPLSLVPDLQPDRLLIAPLDAEASGVEFSVRHALSSTTDIWASYSWSRVADEFAGGDVLRSWDQPQALALGVTWKRAAFEFSTLGAWHRGWPRTTVDLRAAGIAPSALVLGPRNAARWPDYLSLDLQAAWTLPFRNSELSMWVELTNGLNRHNECCTDLGAVDPTTGSPVLERGYWLPRVFNAGATWKFLGGR